jgi:hypothetical protein
MKNTAVDYLFEKLWGIHKDKFTWQMVLKEAKKKEKRQIEDAFWKQPFPGDWAFEEYYKENYEQK